MQIIVADAMKSATDDKVVLNRNRSVVCLSFAHPLSVCLYVQGDKEREKCFKILTALVKHGVNLEKWVGNDRSMHVVCSAGHKELAAWLVDHGAEVDSRTKGVGASPVMLAAKYGHADTIAELLLRDADLKKQDVSIFSSIVWI